MTISFSEHVIITLHLWQKEKKNQNYVFLLKMYLLKENTNLIN